MFSINRKNKVAMKLVACAFSKITNSITSMVLPDLFDPIMHRLCTAKRRGNLVVAFQWAMK
jgi:hypothetical protein